MSNLHPEKILILRPDQIGDCILFSGALRWIREKYPDSQIDLVVKRHIRNLFELCPFVDRVISCNRFFPWEYFRRYFLGRKWRLEKCLINDAIRPLWYQHYDLVIYPVAAPMERFLDAVRRLDACEKWGFGGRMMNIVELENPLNAPEKVFARIWRNTDENMWQHELWRTRSFMEHCGIHTEDVRPCFWLSAEDEKFAALNMPAGEVLGIFPGSASSFKCWPLAKWDRFFREQKIARQVAIFGGKGEKELSVQFAKSAESCSMTSFNFTGKLTLRRMAACMKKCSWVISTDSAGLHTAVALGIPTVGLVGGRHLGRFYPWGDERINRTARLDWDCFHCDTMCKRGDRPCVRDIPVETVLREFRIAVESASALPKVLDGHRVKSARI